MKTWGIVATILSGILVAAMIASMNTCSRTYEIDDASQLFKTEQDSSTTPPTVRRTRCTWNAEFPQFPAVERWTQPRDRIVLKQTTGGAWFFEQQMWTLEVTRGEQEALRVRSGHVKFWAVLLGISLSPLIAFGIGALGLAFLAPRRSPVTNQAV